LLAPTELATDSDVKRTGDEGRQKLVSVREQRIDVWLLLVIKADDTPVIKSEDVYAREFSQESEK